MSRLEKVLEYTRRVKNYHEQYDYVVFTDGSADNYIKSGIQYSYIIYQKGEVFAKNSIFNEDLPKRERTNNTSECLGVVEACKFLIENRLNESKVIFLSDSTFIIDYLMDLDWDRLNPELGYYNSSLELRSLLKEFKKIKKSWIPRELNQEADKLSKL